MTLRLMEVYVPGVPGDRIIDLLKERPKVSIWRDHLAGGEDLVRVVVSVGETEGIIELLNDHYATVEGFRVVVLPVEATYPIPPETVPSEIPRWRRRRQRVSREELYVDISEGARLTWVFLTLAVLSSIVAALGILRDDVIILIGAMVIAPLLGPNVALALGTTLGDRGLVRHALKAATVGLLVAIGIGFAFGLFLEISPDGPQLRPRTTVTLGDILLALAAGGAGTLAVTIGVAAVVVGVMVAVALLPPTVVLGMLLGGGHFEPALGALLLVVAYLVGINLAGVVTFLAQGVRPMTWWEESRAKRATRRAVLVWGLLLVLLVAVISASLGSAPPIP